MNDKIEDIKNELAQVESKISFLMEEIMDIKNQVDDIKNSESLSEMIGNVHQKLYDSENLLMNAQDEANGLIIDDDESES